MLQSFAEDIWLAAGPVVKAAMGFRYPTRMVVIRLADGGLFIWSPIALGDDLRSEINALGPVRHIIAPNTLHHVFLADWIAAYPQAKVHAAPGLRAKRRDITFDAELGDVAEPDWRHQIEQVPVAGNAITTEVVFFHIKSGTVIFADLLQQMPVGWYTGWRGIVARLDLMTAPTPCADTLRSAQISPGLQRSQGGAGRYQPRSDLARKERSDGTRAADRNRRGTVFGQGFCLAAADGQLIGRSGRSCQVNSV